MPPTQLQSPQPSIEVTQLQMEVDDEELVACGKEYEGEYRWTARDRVVVVRMEQYLDRSESLKVEVEELELLLGPEDSEVDLMYILMNARRKKGRRIFEIFSSKGRSAAERDGTSVKGSW